MVWWECIQFLPGRVHAATLQFASCKFQAANLQAARLQVAGLQVAGVQVVVSMFVVMMVAEQCPDHGSSTWSQINAHFLFGCTIGGAPLPDGFLTAIDLAAMRLGPTACVKCHSELVSAINVKVAVGLLEVHFLSTWKPISWHLISCT